MHLDDLRLPFNRHGYIYLITFTRPIDQRKFYYVGQHLGSTLDRAYVGSGFRLHQLFNKYGKKGNCRRLTWAYSQDELNFTETLFIHLAKLEWGRDCINLMNGGANGRAHESTRRKQSEVQQRRTPEAKKAKSDKHKATLKAIPPHIRALTGQKIREAHVGIPLSREHRNNIVKAHANRPSNEEKLRIERISAAWYNKPEYERMAITEKTASANRGKVRSLEARQAESRTKQNKSPEEKARISAALVERLLLHHLP